MPTSLLPILPGTLPPGICFASEQERLNTFSEYQNAQLAGGLAFYNYGDDLPAVENQGYPWLRTTDGLWYIFSGVWRSPRPICEQDIYYRILWMGSEANVPLKDGGTAGVADESTGPFWEIDTAFAGRSPMAPGEIPTSNPTKNLAVGEAFGEGAHAQTAQELYPHTHTPDPTQADGFLGHAVVGAPATYNVGGGGDTISMPQTAAAGGNTDEEAEPSNVVHPVLGCWVLKPTIRKYYTVS